MGYIVSVVLGWKGKKIIEKGRELGYNFNTEEADSFYVVNREKSSEELVQVYTDILKKVMKFEVVKEKKEDWLHTFKVKTPRGEKTLRPIQFVTHGEIYDEDDVEEIVFGISLTNAFLKSLLDWDMSSGEGSFSFSLTEEKQKQMKAIKKRIVKTYPAFEDAEIIFELVHQ